MQEIRAGIVGFGGFCKGVHVPCMRRIEGLRFAAVCDMTDQRRDEAREQLGQDVRLYADLDEMLSAGGLDAVYVIVKPAAMVDVVPRVAQAGLPVFCEKPPGATLADTQAMAEACDAAGVINQVAFNRRHGPYTARLADWLAESGPLTRIEVSFRRVFTAAPTRVVGSGVHAIDKMLSLTGPVRRVFSARSARREGEGWCQLHAAFEFASGASGSFQYDNRSGEPLEQYRLSCVSDDTLTVRQLTLDFPPPTPQAVAAGVTLRTLAYRDWAKGDGPVFDDETERFELDLADRDAILVGGGYLAEHETFAAALRSGTPASPTFRETIHTMQVAEAMQAGGFHEFDV